MRKIKYLILIITLIVGFLCEAEIFQFELYNFGGAYYRGSSFRFDSEEERISLLSRVEELANENKVGVFLNEITQMDRYNKQLYIYSNEIAKDEIIKKNNIKQKTYHSLLNGNTEVFYKNFSEIKKYENRYIMKIYFTGTKSDIVNLYNQIKDDYQIVYPKIYGGGETDNMYAIFGLIAVIMVVLTIIHIYYCKKEVVVRISFGENVWKIIAKNIIFEIVASAAIFLLTHFVIFQFVSGQFMELQIFGVYMLGVVVSCLMYLSYAFYDIRFAFANGTNTGAMLTGIYVAKVVVSLVIIVGIGTNFTIVKENNFLIKGDYEENYEGYSYLYLKDKVNYDWELATQEEWEEEEYRSDEEMPQMIESIYEKYYDVTNPLICVEVLEDRNHYIIANKNASNLVKEFMNVKKYKEDVLIIMPHDADEKFVKEIAGSEIDYIIDNENDVQTKIVKYDENKNFTYINQSKTLGVDTVNNPVIIYIQDDMLSKNMDVSELEYDMLFQISEEQLEQIKTEYELEERGYELIAADFKKNYEYYQGFVKNLISFISSVSMFLFLLLMVLITIINTLEYQINAMKLALKKVIGYSLFEKNRRTLIFCVGIDLLIAICATCYRIYNGKMTAVETTAQVALLVTVLELAVCVINIYRIERKSIVKILKGGCL